MKVDLLESYNVDFIFVHKDTPRRIHFEISD